MSAPTRVQKVENNYSGASGVTLTFASNVTAGNLLAVMVCQAGAANRVISAVTDNLANSYSRAVQGGVAGTDIQAEIWYAKNIAGGACTITIQWANGNDSKDILCLEYSGCDKTAPLDVTDSIVQASATQHDSTTSADTTSSAGAAILCIGGLNGNTATLAPGVGYTNLVALNADICFLEQLAAAAVVGTRGDWTSTNPRTNTGVLASFKSASGTTTITVGFSVPVEWLGTVPNQVSLAAEWLATVLTSPALPAEWLFSILTSPSLPAEWLASQIASVSVPVEFLGTVQTAPALPAEWLGSLALGATIPAEIMQTILANQTAIAEWLATASGGATLASEWLATMVCHQILPVDWTGAAAQPDAVFSLGFRGDICLLSARGDVFRLAPRGDVSILRGPAGR